MAGRMSRISCTIDIFLPAQDIWREYRHLVSGAVLFSPGPGVERLLRRRTWPGTMGT